jgi:DNA-binding MarR family transcriptional regulator
MTSKARLQPKRVLSAPNRPSTAGDDAREHALEALHCWLAVVQAYNQCDEALTRMLSQAGYTMAQYEVVVRLKREPDQTQQELADRCFQAKSVVSTLLKKLEQDGWVSRESDASDARAKRLRLTPLGNEHAKRLIKVQSHLVGAMASGLTQDEVVRTRQAMEKVSGNLDRLGAKM